MSIQSNNSNYDFSNSFHSHGAGAKTGFIGAEMSFEEPLQKPIKLILYSVYHSILEIDEEHNATLNYLI